MRTKDLKKFGKGVIGVIALKLIFLGLFLIFQACEKTEFPSETEAKDNFMEALKSTADNLKQIPVSKHNPKAHVYSRDDDQFLMRTICFSEIVPVDDFGEFVELMDEEEMLPPEEAVGLEYCFDIPVEVTYETLEPAMQEARNFLYTRGFTDTEIDEMIVDEGGSEEDLIMTVALIIEAENSGIELLVLDHIKELFMPNTAFAQTWADVGRCAVAAIGADLFQGLASESGSKRDIFNKKAIKKLFGKVAARMLGPVGVAIAVVTFSLCLWG